MSQGRKQPQVFLSSLNHESGDLLKNKEKQDYNVIPRYD
jgi:hypothetical protein